MSKVDPNNITNVVVTGKSGAGKQPRIDVLIKEFDLKQLSTGDIFRYYLGKFNEYGYLDDLGKFWDENTKKFIPDNKIFAELKTDDNDILLGMKAKFFVDKGLFVLDYITNALFESAFSKNNYKNQILDGYPRTKDQSSFLVELLEEHNSKIDFILLVDNTDERIIERTVQRRICPVCKKVYHLKYKPPINGYCECGAKVIQRSDDTEEKIRSRLDEFKNKTVPALEYLQSKGIPVVKVPGHLEIFTDENIKNNVMNELKKLY